jgi:hypothetical protein
MASEAVSILRHRSIEEARAERLGRHDTESEVMWRTPLAT